MSLRTEIKFGFVHRFVAALTRPSNATSHDFREDLGTCDGGPSCARLRLGSLGPPIFILLPLAGDRPARRVAHSRHSSLHEFQHPSTANHAWPSSRCPFPSLSLERLLYFAVLASLSSVSSSLSLHDQPAAAQTCASRVRSKELIAAVDVANSEISKCCIQSSYSMIFQDGTNINDLIEEQF